MNHQALSASFVPGRAAGEGRQAGLNSAALSRSGRAAYYHTAGLVNWARLGARSGGQGCGHNAAVLRAGPSSRGSPRPWLCDHQAGHLLSQSSHCCSLEMPSVRRDEAGSRNVPQPKHQCPRHPSRPACPSCLGKETGLEDRPGPSHIKAPPVPAQGRPLPGSLPGRGATGRGQELPAPAWAGRHTGGMFLPLPRPPSACRPAHPGTAECKAWGAMGVL